MLFFGPHIARRKNQVEKKDKMLFFGPRVARRKNQVEKKDKMLFFGPHIARRKNRLILWPSLFLRFFYMCLFSSFFRVFFSIFK